MYINLSKENKIKELNNYENCNRTQKLSKIINFQKKYMFVLDKYIQNNYNFKFKIIYFTHFINKDIEILNNIIFIRLSTNLSDNVSAAYIKYLNKLLCEPKIFNTIKNLIN